MRVSLPRVTSLEHRHNLFPLFQQAIAPKFVAEQEKLLGERRRRRKFLSWIVLWLIIWQRLNARHCLNAALTEASRLVGRISLNTSGFSRARTRLSLPLVERVVDQLMSFLLERCAEPFRWRGMQVFLLDGSSVSLEHTRELVRRFGVAGLSHWPKMVVVVAHELMTGIAIRPASGAMYGQHSTNETHLAPDVLRRLPKRALIVADRGFGILKTVYHITQQGHQALVRMTKNRARSLMPVLPKTTSRHPVVWSPSKYERYKYTHEQPGVLPLDTQVSGWLVAVRLQPRKGFRPKEQVLYFFTTVEASPTELAELYGLRWNIETDLRSIKNSVDMHRLTAKSVSMVQKELLLGIAAYSLVRGAMALAAQQAGIKPRELSFSACLERIVAAIAQLQLANSRRLQSLLLQQLLDSLALCKSPRRRRKQRPQPRYTHRRSPKFPVFTGSRQQAIAKFMNLK